MKRPLTITKAQRKMLREHLTNLVAYEKEEADAYRSVGMTTDADLCMANAKAFRIALRAVLALPVEEGKKR